MLSVNRLRERKSDIVLDEEWMLDSGAFSQLQSNGEFTDSPAEYATLIERWSRCGTMVAAVSQDYMCEPHQLEATGGTVLEHQRWTIQRYDEIRRHLEGTNIYLLPVLQGWHVQEYLRHIEMYEDRLPDSSWVGLGSVCQRNSSPADIQLIISRIASKRPDLRLHGFGIKTTALKRKAIRENLYSADSMAWSYNARRNGGDANSPYEAREFYDSLTSKKKAPLFR